MDQQRIKEILGKIEQTRVAVYGDFCIDAYWILDPKGSEVSEETGLQARAVRRHYYSLGGASNVVANLAALKPKSIQVVGVVGDDIFGRELRRQFDALGVDASHLVVQREHYDTVAFGKPYREKVEEPRIDFGFFNRRSEATDAALLEGIRHALKTSDALIVNQQVPGSITNLGFIDRANRLFAEFPDKVVLLDSRHFGDKFEHIVRKTNDREAARLNGVELAHGENPTLDEVKGYAQTLYGQFKKPVFLTRGSRGMLAIDGKGVHEISGIQLLKKLDPVGAGDTVTSALALCLGAGVPPAEAAEFANFAAAVTVQKLFQTGTASGEEILAVAKDPDFIYQPELAESPRKARYAPGTEIEITGEWPVACDGSEKGRSGLYSSTKSPSAQSAAARRGSISLKNGNDETFDVRPGFEGEKSNPEIFPPQSRPDLPFSDPGRNSRLAPIRHAVFDNDGTISTLRQGWEQIMAPVMMKAVLGDRFQTADESLYRKVQKRVLDYIDKSTGIQTIVQMQGLVELVREFGIVPADQVLDRFGYKRIYNEALMQMVNDRIAKLERGQLDVTDFTVKGAVEFARALRERGVTLYLASGTDHEDVLREARVLGHADLFNGGIYGAVGDIDSCSKKMVLDRILTENRLSGAQLAVFGDGPVELRESRKRGGLAVGVASDEVRRFGLNLDKRARLIKAGAHLVVPDFSQRDQLLRLLFGESNG
jgi:rfaE bifunctional protein kinase chain/domain